MNKSKKKEMKKEKKKESKEGRKKGRKEERREIYIERVEQIDKQTDSRNKEVEISSNFSMFH